MLHQRRPDDSNQRLVQILVLLAGRLLLRVIIDIGKTLPDGVKIACIRQIRVGCLEQLVTRRQRIRRLLVGFDLVLQILVLAREIVDLLLLLADRRRLVVRLLGDNLELRRRVLADLLDLRRQHEKAHHRGTDQEPDADVEERHRERYARRLQRRTAPVRRLNDRLVSVAVHHHAAVLLRLRLFLFLLLRKPTLLDLCLIPQRRRIAHILSGAVGKLLLRPAVLPRFYIKKR